MSQDDLILPNFWVRPGCILSVRWKPETSHRSIDLAFYWFHGFQSLSLNNPENQETIGWLSWCWKKCRQEGQGLDFWKFSGRFLWKKHVKKDESAKQYVGEAKNNDLWQGSRAENQWGTNNGGTWQILKANFGTTWCSPVMYMYILLCKCQWLFHLFMGLWTNLQDNKLYVPTVLSVMFTNLARYLHMQFLAR